MADWIEHTELGKRPRGEEADNDDDDDDVIIIRRPRGIEPPAPAASPVALAEQLERTGACVVRHPWFAANIDALERRFDAALTSFPEYKRTPGREPLYVKGSFAALGNAASFHNPFVRFLRLHVMAALWPMFSALTSESGNAIAQIVDRMLYRLPNVKPVADKWHRDVYPEARRGERIYGGWINLTAHPQYLSCKLGTHRDEIVVDNRGFATVSDAQLAELTAAARAGRTDTVVIPPGGVLVFDERTLHEVLPRVFPHAVKRLFTAWLETPMESRFTVHDYEKLLDAQAVMPLKSGQIPSMYAKNDLRFRRPDLLAWARDDLKPPMVRADGLPFEHAPSLEAAGFQLYPDYEHPEINLFLARRSHLLPAEVGDGAAPLVLRSL